MLIFLGTITTNFLIKDYKLTPQERIEAERKKAEKKARKGIVTPQEPVIETVKPRRGRKAK